MKAIIFLSIFLLGLTSCSKDENETPPSISGSWKLTEIYSSDGGSNSGWHPVTNGYTYQFNSNGTFTSNRFSECNTGTYTLTSANEVKLVYTCSSFPNSYIEKIKSLTNSELILEPTYMNCDEGCNVKLTRIN